MSHSTRSPRQPDTDGGSVAAPSTEADDTAEAENTAADNTAEVEDTPAAHVGEQRRETDTADERPEAGAADDRPEAGTADDQPEEATAEDPPGGRPPGRSRGAGWWGWRRKYPQAARGVTVGTTVLAGALVLFALLLPNHLDRLTFGAFLRIPAEGVLLAGLLLVLPPRPRRVVAMVAGAGLGLMAVLKCIDMGFYSVLDRPFDLVLDWILFGYAVDFLNESVGPTGAKLAVIAAIALIVALLVLVTLAVIRLTDLMARHRPVAARTTLVLGTAWITCVTLGVQITDVPVAAKTNAVILQNRAHQVRAGIRDGRVFAEQSSVDAFAGTPPDQLLTGLRGKDVLFTFIESYGRSAIEDPAMAKQVGAVLDDGTSSLKAAGFSSQSGWLKSPVAGAGSWLAHSTFLSGLWIKNQQRYRNLTSSKRATLTSYFQKSGAWRTVGIVPGVRRAWPEGKFFGLDHIYDSEHLGYQGPYFSWTPVPDQFSLEAFERLEHGKKDRKPMMAEIILASSHNPWAPIARTVDWDDLGDGSVFDQIKKEGKDPKEVWKSPESVRTEYRRAIEYSLTSLIQYMERYGDKNTVLVFLGDHQPNPTVTGSDAGKDVPVTVVAHDPKVLDKISDWGWTDGLKPAKDAPRWGMDKFRDRFMTAYGPDKG
ncbi:sulfatase [Streptomyces sp. NPDC058274]|uniref:sulfatase n=1 Tax=Streptomyces sp. NPDC058274 TaxID=3346416 RepID=UPI0036E5144F